MPNVKTLVFDLGKVLIDWDPRYLYRKLIPDESEMDFFLAEICSPEWNAQMDRGKSFQEAVDELAVVYPKYSKQIQAYYSRWEEMILGPIQGTVKILERLREAGYPLAALSNWSAETYPKVANRFALLKLFDPLVISGEVGLIKPDPEIYNYLLKKINREAKDCIFIDDSESNIRTAEEMGFISIHFSSPEELGRNLEELGVLKNVRN